VGETNFIERDEFTVKDFFEAAFPWIAMGLGLALWAASLKKNSDAKNSGEEKQNRGTEGMLIGVCIGIMASLVFNWSLGMGAGLGMLLGSCAGILLKKG